MSASTDVPIGLGSFHLGDPISRRQGKARSVRPVILQIRRTTAACNPDIHQGTAPARSDAPQRTFAAPMAIATEMREVRADSTPLEVWEGTVLEVDHVTRVVQVLLDAKIGQMPRHTAEIDLDSISPQDHDLVRPGAVFYLTLYKRSIPSVENIQELRFRRRPSWSAGQLNQIDEDASMLLSKMKALPSAA